ncbi:MAG TPA: energy transducer TonB [Blastocatellia bacterium]|nr:energy transducer TonB [Blastocatellia bacterium]
MFERLVVSTKEHRNGRTARYFAVTSLIYMFGAVCAVAVSVMVSNPKLADANSLPTANLIVALPPLGRPELKPAAAAQPQSASHPDTSNPMPLDELLKDPQNASEQTKFTGLPTPGLVEDSSAIGFGSPEGVPGGPPSINLNYESDSNASVSPPPPPPPLKPQTVETDKRPVRLASNVLQGKVIERREPPYPLLARTAGVQGSVMVEIIISPDGRVESARAVSGHPLLVPASLEAARRWRFEPTLLNGTPVRVAGVITFVFKLQ